MNSAIKIENLTVSYSKCDAVNSISLSINQGEYVNIIGPNGGGKTTLIKSILGLLKPDNGKITILSKPPNKGRVFVGYVPQKAETEPNFPITVLETVQTAFLKPKLNPFARFDKEEKEKASMILEKMGISNLANKQINELSGGEFGRLLIARALARDPEILLLDEPCANIDFASAEKIYEILNSLNNKGCTIIMISHDINRVIQSGKRTVFINRTVLFDGIPTDDIYKL